MICPVSNYTLQLQRLDELVLIEYKHTQAPAFKHMRTHTHTHIKARPAWLEPPACVVCVLCHLVVASDVASSRGPFNLYTCCIVTLLPQMQWVCVAFFQLLFFFAWSPFPPLKVLSASLSKRCISLKLPWSGQMENIDKVMVLDASCWFRSFFWIPLSHHFFVAFETFFIPCGTSRSIPNILL